MSEWSTRFKEGDIVELAGPEFDDPYWPGPGERGTVHQHQDADKMRRRE
jgi:hypothetical protein